MIDAYETMLTIESYYETLKIQLEEVKAQVQDDVLEEINIRKEGVNPTAMFVKKRDERKAAVVRLELPLPNCQKPFFFFEKVVHPHQVEYRAME